MTEYLVLDAEGPVALSLGGGKGQALSRLSLAGFSVPEGKILSTNAYNTFVDAHSIRKQILEASLPEVQSGKLVFNKAALRVRTLFDRQPLTDDLNTALASVYEELGGDQHPLAVRSSATLEDQPEQSFAGQHASYLNITGFEALTEAVKNCWISLWSERALSYRYQVGITNTDVAMAVVIQRLVLADVSGVLFTANPVTGERNEIHINASYGLGEAVVSGSVNPDEFVLDRSTFGVQSSRFGTGADHQEEDAIDNVRIRSDESPQFGNACLESSQLTTLGHQAVAIEKTFRGIPQDIEWAFSGDELWILQSRAITRLPPEPLRDVRWNPPEPGAYLQRSQWVEHVPDPVSTLFEDLHMRRSLQEAWGRNLTKRGNHDFEDTQPPASFVLTTTVNGFAYRQVGEPPRTGKPYSIRRKHRSRFARYWTLLRIYLTFTPMWRYVALPRYLKQIRSWDQLDPATASIEQLWNGIRALSHADAAYWFNGGVWNAFSLSRGTESQLQNFFHEFGNSQLSSGQFLRGLKSPAFDAQRSLFRIAEMIRSNDVLCHKLITHSPHQILDILTSNSDNKEITDALDDHFAKFGHQLHTLDFCEPLELERPFNTLRSLHNYLVQPDLDPNKSRERLKQEQRRVRRSAVNHFSGRLKLNFWWRLWLARRYYPNREEAMSHLGRAWIVLRPLALELGRRLVDRGTLHDADDVFYLNSEELGRAIRSIVAVDRMPETHRHAHYPNGAAIPELAQKASDRRTLRSRRKNLNPPFLIPGPPPWSPLTSPTVDERAENVLRGSPVSPGRVTGEACVIRSIDELAELRSGTILVCPTTTPAWTPIFPQVIGLVTDIGGVLAHGSIVAREFGIPAVLGLVDATEKIQDGQMITIDGDLGTVEI